MSTATKGTSRITRASAAVAVQCDGPARQHTEPMPSGIDVLAQFLRRPPVLPAGDDNARSNESKQPFQRPLMVQGS